ncbi:MAG: hypothetical protein M3O03_15090 [Pseudomonadota bacterium]|nr:hypothetical protein [Pseudomonadota bacterium]
MDWNRAIEVNRQAVIQVLDEIFALLELALAGTMLRLPQALYLAVETLLRPTEAVVRRLIVIAARDLAAKPIAVRPMPEGLVIVSRGLKNPAFALFDARKRFAERDVQEATPEGGPRIHSFESFFQAHAPRAAPPDTSLDATQLLRRFQSVKHALETLPRQALRLVRWKDRRRLMENPKFRSPLRPGKPPGHRDKPKHKIDFVLRDCHGLAFDALREDSS